MCSEAGNNTRPAGVMSSVYSRIKATIKNLSVCLRSVRILPTRLQSRTPECPTRITVFNVAVDNLVSQARLSDRVYFKSPSCKHRAICEVDWAKEKHLCLSWQPTDLEVRIRLPCKDSFRRVFNGQGIEIPTSWQLDYFKRGKWVRFRVGKEYAKTIGPFLDVVFKQVYGCPEDYVVDGYIPPDYDHFV